MSRFKRNSATEWRPTALNPFRYAMPDDADLAAFTDLTAGVDERSDGCWGFWLAAWRDDQEADGGFHRAARSPYMAEGVEPTEAMARASLDATIVATLATLASARRRRVASSSQRINVAERLAE
jgi:hypothetical protein